MKINDKCSKNSDKLPQCSNLYLGKVQAVLAQGKQEEPLRISFSGGTGQLNLGFLVFIAEDEHQEHARMELAVIKA